jgi:endonuclease-8
MEATASLWDRVVALLRDGVRQGAIVTVDPAMVERPVGARRRGEATVTRRGRPTTWVYGQECCRRCAAPVRSWELAGRRCYACERCQPPSPPAP